MGDDSDNPSKDEPADRSDLNTDQKPGSYVAKMTSKLAERLGFRYAATGILFPFSGWFSKDD